MLGLLDLEVVGHAGRTGTSPSRRPPRLLAAAADERVADRPLEVEPERVAVLVGLGLAAALVAEPGAGHLVLADLVLREVA